MVYSIIQKSSPYFVIPLFIFDAIPIFYITWMLCPRNIRRF